MAEPTRGSFRLIYCSRNLIPEDQRNKELGGLFSAARSNNKARGVCARLRGASRTLSEAHGLHPSSYSCGTNGSKTGPLSVTDGPETALVPHLYDDAPAETLAPGTSAGSAGGVR